MKRIQYHLYILILASLLTCTSRENRSPLSPIAEKENFISGVDISRYPEIRGSEPVFYNEHKQEEDFLSILKANGVNTIRLRLWVNPSEGHSGLEEVKTFSQELRSLGFKIWLCVHYSDTWADPNQQKMPLQWQGLSFSQLKDEVREYTETILKEIKPELIQIGNEINPGFLHPTGNLNQHPDQFLDLMRSAIGVVREHSPDTQIILHYAGWQGAASFFEKVKTLDYDIIGLSYYPLWHGKDLSAFGRAMQNLSKNYQKDILIAETAYPFTLNWNDWTNNIVGLEEQILPDFPASPIGQKEFIHQIKKIILEETPGGIGFCYWGGELIAWKGSESPEASPWENQALFDFENQALPVLKEFDLLE